MEEKPQTYISGLPNLQFTSLDTESDYLKQKKKKKKNVQKLVTEICYFRDF